MFALFCNRPSKKERAHRQVLSHQDVPRCHDVVLGIQPRVQLDVLKCPRNAQLCQLVRAHASYFLSVKIDFTLLRFVKAIDAIEQRGLTRAVRSDDSQDLVVANIETHVRERSDAAKV